MNQFPLLSMCKQLVPGDICYLDLHFIPDYGRGLKGDNFPSPFRPKPLRASVISNLIAKLGFTLLSPAQSPKPCSLSWVADRLLQGHVLPTGQHWRLQLGGVRGLQQHAAVPEPAPPRGPGRRALARGHDPGQPRGWGHLRGHWHPRGTGQDQATDANTALHQR